MHGGVMERMRSIVRLVKGLSLLGLTTSVSLISGFFIRRGYERYLQVQNMRAFEARFEKTSIKESMNHEYTGSYITPDMGDIIAILSLERLGIKVTVVEGIEKHSLRISAGHFEESAMAGGGNFAIAGHSSVLYTCLFNKLHEALIGDRIEVLTKDAKHIYEVTGMYVVSDTELGYIGKSEESIITIVTCTDMGRRRLIIRGVEVEV